MKNILTIAIVLASVNVFASRASTNALGNSAHITDQYSPEVIAVDGQSLVIETGTTSSTLVTADAANPKYAEGQLTKTVGPGNLSLTLGHQDLTVWTNRNAVGIAAVLTQQNPLELTYGMKMDDMAFGAGLIYSNYDRKETLPTKAQKESSVGLKFGVATSVFYGRAKIILVDKYVDDATAIDYKAKTTFDLTGGMNFGSTSVHGQIAIGGAKVTTSGNDFKDTEGMTISVKVVDTIKSEGNDFFYGAGLVSNSLKEKKVDTKTTTLNLPLIIGLEATATSWLKLRASVTQDVLLSNEKTTDATTPANDTEANPGLNTTKFAAGAGLTYNKLMVDGSLTAASTVDPSVQSINANNLLGSVSLTYKF